MAMATTAAKGSEVTIACRFVPHDQWLVTHVDPSWKIKHLKFWLLSRCKPANLPAPVDINPSRYRPSSPITFAPYPNRRPISPIRFAHPASFPRTRSSEGDNSDSDDLHDDSDRASDWDSAYDSGNTDPPSTRRRRRVRSPTLPPLTIPPPLPIPPPIVDIEPSSHPMEPTGADADLLTQYTLIRFATGQILEDDFQGSWYALRPFELLEIHRIGVVIRLPRLVASEYIIPYFEAHVRALRVVGGVGHLHSYPDPEDDRRGARSPGDDDGSKKGKGREKDKERERGRDGDRPKKGKGKDSDTPAKLERATKKRKLEWRDRWLVICADVLNVCKDQNDINPQQLPLSSLVALRGADHLVRTNLSSLAPAGSHRIICAKFCFDREPRLSAREREIERGKERRRESTPTLITSGLGSNILASSPPKGNFDEARGDIDTSMATPVLKKPSMQLGSRERDQSPTSTVSSPHDATFPSTREEEAEEGAEGEWVVLDMLEDGAYTSILRILHRLFPSPTSSFIPAFSSRTSHAHMCSTTPFPSPTSPSTSLPSPILNHLPTDAMKYNRNPRHAYDKQTGKAKGVGEREAYLQTLRPSLPRTFGGVPYPEWRMLVVERAQRAGVGDASSAVREFLWGKWDGLSVGEDLRRHAEHTASTSEVWRNEDTSSYISSRPTTPVSAIYNPLDADDIPSVEDGDPADKNDLDAGTTYSDDSAEDSSEVEWDGWVGDLERQAQACVLRRLLEGQKQQRSEDTYAHTDRDQQPQVHAHIHAATQRLFQEGRRALEPSAVVTPMNTSLPSFPPTSGSAVFGTVSESGSSIPNTEPSTSIFGVYAGREVYRTQLRTKMSIEEVLDGATAIPVVPGSLETPAGQMVMTTARGTIVSAPPSRKSSLIANSSGNSGTVGSIFSRKKMKERERDKEDEGDWDDTAREWEREMEIESAAGREREREKPLPLPPLSLSVSAPSLAETSSSLVVGSQPLQPTTSMRTFTASAAAAGSMRSRSSILRHVRSGSSLYGRMSSPLTEESSDVTQVTPGTGVRTKKTGLGLVRGVSVRAGKFVKGLDAAIDFVDAR